MRFSAYVFQQKDVDADHDDGQDIAERRPMICPEAEYHPRNRRADEGKAQKSARNGLERPKFSAFVPDALPFARIVRIENEFPEQIQDGRAENKHRNQFIHGFVRQKNDVAAMVATDRMIDKIWLIQKDFSVKMMMRSATIAMATFAPVDILTHSFLIFVTIILLSAS